MAFENCAVNSIDFLVPWLHCSSQPHLRLHAFALECEVGFLKVTLSTPDKRQ